MTEGDELPASPGHQLLILSAKRIYEVVPRFDRLTLRGRRQPGRGNPVCPA
jgi:hypothetical protein